MQIGLIEDGWPYLGRLEAFILVLLFIWTITILISAYFKYIPTIRGIKKYGEEKAKDIDGKKINPLAKIILEEIWEIQNLKNAAGQTHMISLEIEKIRKRVKKAFLLKHYLVRIFLIVGVFIGFLVISKTFLFIARGISGKDISRSFVAAALYTVAEEMPIIIFTAFYICFLIGAIISIKTIIKSLMIEIEIRI